MGVLACPLLAAREGTRFDRRDGGYAYQQRTATVLGGRDGYPTPALGARAAGPQSSRCGHGRPRPQKSRRRAFWAAEDGSCAGQPGRLRCWAAEDGYPTGAPAAEIVGWASSPVSFLAAEAGSCAGQPGRRLCLPAEDGYPTGALAAEIVGWASSPVRLSAGKRL